MEQLRHSRDSFHPDKGRLLKPGVFSLLLHIALAGFLMLNMKPTVTKGGASIYRVTIRPFSPPGDGLPQGGSGAGLPGRSPASPVVEKLKPEQGFKQTETGDRAKSDPKKTEKKLEKPEKGRAVQPAKKEKGFGKSLQEAMADIHKEVALNEIQKKVARREKTERGAKEGQPSFSPSQGSITSSSRESSPAGSGTGSGAGAGSGSGVFSTGGFPGGSPGRSSVLEAKLNDYYSMIWAKIKQEWTLPQNLPKDKLDLEAIIVVIIEKDGKVQKSYFEKKSGNTLYDQMAMRAIKKAEPFPPIPKEFSDEPFEIGIRFHPD
jgi:colicin import membrane protein/protein TonB